MGEQYTLRDKIAIVTGAASGIGTATARHLRQAGCNLVVADLDEEGVRSVAAEVDGLAVTMDVSDPDAWDRLATRVTNEYGGADFAHLNAGIVTMPYPYRLEDVTLAHYRRLMGVNLDGVVFAATKLAPVIARRGGGAIVATGSVGGLNPWPEDPYYAAAKLGVVGFVRSAAAKLGELGVRIHAICPGLVQTNIIRGFVQQKIDDAALPVLDPRDVALAVADLLTADGTGLVRTIVPGVGVREYVFPNASAS
jgi:NAD(P)-dependent dehydrogenase (short-subunit alcohol dehydrogenase family)